MVQENTPLFLVPEVGATAEQPRVCVPAGPWSAHVAEPTPDLASVTVMLQVTFCAAAETVTEVGTSARSVRPGATVSGSEVTTRS
jgi:hypothetical protein